MRTRSVRNIVLLTLLLVILILTVSLAGIFIPGFYSAENFNWQIQSRAQDLADLLLVVPVLAGSALLVFIGFPGALPVWSGTLLYLAYTFAIYCFSVHFNSLFLVYCLVLGISAFRFLFFTRSETGSYPSAYRPRLQRFTSGYFIVVAVLFLLLWLSDIVPASISHMRPQSLEGTGLATNPVHVLDLSFLLPATAAIGLLAWRRNPLALQLMPVILTFFVLMYLTIAVLTLLMLRNGLPANSFVAVVMLILALFSAVLLAMNLSSEKTKT